ncbi:MAG TPA: nucleotidyltransferase domain-containing protein [Hanamia sp.]|nr:nucleotidyltransferase domain-containing protein [Hanamia sp.]
MAYFDMFNYPVTRDELILFSTEKMDFLSINESLDQLLHEKIIYKSDEFYSLQNKPQLTERRRDGNKRAAEQLKIAKCVSKILRWFPFVQAIAISGSLSKNYAEEKSDIDFFIITSSDRLWIARTCMHIFKKLTYIVGKQNWFCMNYYVDEMEMEIVEKNAFTAMEIVTLLPVQGIDCFQNFIKANCWATNYFPEQVISIKGNRKIKKVFIRKWIEKIFQSALGDATDKWLMNLTDKRWKKKAQQGKVNDHGKKMGMLTGRHFSKPDPKNFQAKVVQKYERSVKQLIESIEQPVTS